MKLSLAAALHGFEKQRLAEEFAAGDQRVDARDVHVNDAARAHIEVAHFAIAHLSFGQSDEGAGGVDQRVRKIGEQAVVIRFAREGDGVAFRFGTVAPAIEDGEDDWFWTFRHVSDGRLARETMNARAAKWPLNSQRCQDGALLDGANEIAEQAVGGGDYCGFMLDD